MNIQAMMKQAKQLQKEMTSAKNEIDNKTYIGTSSFVSAEVRGTKEVLNVKINVETLEKEDLEMLEDMIVVAINDANKQIDADIDAKLGKYTKGMPGLF